MDIHKVLMVMKDVAYGKRVAEIISKEYHNIIFTVMSEESLKEKETSYWYSQDCEKFHIKITDLLDKKDGADFFICDTKEHEGVDDKSIIYKYSHRDELIEKLFLKMSSTFNNRQIFNKRDKTKIICVTSSSGGMGKSVVSLGISQEFRRFHDKKVLYLSLEDIESTEKYFKIDRGKDLSKFLYYYEKRNIEHNKRNNINFYRNDVYKMEKENIQNEINQIIETFLIKDDFGVYTFSPSKYINELKLLDFDYFRNLIEKIYSSHKFDFIIFEIQDIADEKSKWLMDIASKIIIIRKEKNKIKDEKFINVLKNLSITNVEEKKKEVWNFTTLIDSEEREEEESNRFKRFKNVKNLTNDKDLQENVAIKNEVRCCIYEDKESLKEDRINLDRDFGTGIKELAENLIL